MEKVFEYVLKIRWLIILLVAGITVFLALQIPRIKINSDVLSSLPDNDPDAVLLKKIGAQFGGNKTGMIILESENVFTAEVLEHIKQVTDTIKDIEGVSSVTSLTSIMDIQEGEDGMEVGPLIDENDMPDSPNELNMLKDKVLSDIRYKGTIVSEDGTTAIIIFSLYDDADIHLLANTVKKKTEALNLPEKVYYAGSPMMITSISHLISSDLIKLLPVAFLLITHCTLPRIQVSEGSCCAIAYGIHFNHLGNRYHVTGPIRNEHGYEQYTNSFAGCRLSLCHSCAEQD